MQIKAVILSFLLLVFLVTLSRSAESDKTTNATTEPEVTVMMVPGTMMVPEVSTMMVPVAPPPDLECLDNGAVCTHDDSSVSWENGALFFVL